MRAEKHGLRCRRLAGVLAAVLLCAVFAGSGFAAAPVAVQLDGTMIAFTDAQPEIVNGRTFLPYRAVFEALGAQVSYEEASRTAIAARNGITVRVPIGATEVTVLQNGESRTLKMDVASYVKNGRTYVPVRFMAQALNCVVGWDADDRTVILIDTEKMAAELMEGWYYGNIGRFYEMLAGFRNGNWAVEGAMEHRVEQNGTTLVTTQAVYDGLTAGEKSQIHLAMETDRSAWYEVMAAAQGMTLEEYGVTENDLFAVMELEMRSDAGVGETYLCVDSAAGAGAELPVGVWLRMGERAELAGVDLTALLRVEGDTNVGETISRTLNALTFDNRDTAMTQVMMEAGLVAANLSDVAFRNEKDGRHSADWRVGNVNHSLVLTMDKEWNVTAAVLTQTSTDASGTVVNRTAVDREGRITVDMTVTAGGQTVVVRQDGFYTAVDADPECTPPAGAAVIAYGE